jgi:hypothetical protein
MSMSKHFAVRVPFTQLANWETYCRVWAAHLRTQFECMAVDSSTLTWLLQLSDFRSDAQFLAGLKQLGIEVETLTPLEADERAEGGEWVPGMDVASTTVD